MRSASLALALALVGCGGGGSGGPTGPEPGSRENPLAECSFPSTEAYFAANISCKVVYASLEPGEVPRRWINLYYVGPAKCEGGCRILEGDTLAEDLPTGEDVPDDEANSEIEDD